MVLGLSLVMWDLLLQPIYSLFGEPAYLPNGLWDLGSPPGIESVCPALKGRFLFLFFLLNYLVAAGVSCGLRNL